MITRNRIMDGMMMGNGTLELNDGWGDGATVHNTVMKSCDDPEIIPIHHVRKEAVLSIKAHVIVREDLYHVSDERLAWLIQQTMYADIVHRLSDIHDLVESASRDKVMHEIIRLREDIQK